MLQKEKDGIQERTCERSPRNWGILGLATLRWVLAYGVNTEDLRICRGLGGIRAFSSCGPTAFYLRTIYGTIADLQPLKNIVMYRVVQREWNVPER